jgi:hypothetical protein
LEHRLSIHMYKAHREEYMKDMDRKWKEGAAERKRLFGPIQRNQRRSRREGVRDSGNDLQENGGHQ